MAVPADRPGSNLDEQTVKGFGREWTRFDQRDVPQAELEATFDDYFRLFPWHLLTDASEGFDLGCGSGRWARLVAPRVGRLHCIDASAEALVVARRALAPADNVLFHRRSVDELPFPDGSMDFGYSLGVLHHVPSTAAGIASCAQKLKPGAPLLLYLYYAFDNRPSWYRHLWRVSDLVRKVVSRLPPLPRHAIAAAVAAGIYFPFARAAGFLERRGRDVSEFPLAFYRHRSFYTMRTDALDRLGTRLEQRFTRSEIETMMRAAGLTDVVFSDAPPFWCAVGFRTRRGHPADALRR